MRRKNCSSHQNTWCERVFLFCLHITMFLFLLFSVTYHVKRIKARKSGKKNTNWFLSVGDRSGGHKCLEINFLRLEMEIGDSWLEILWQLEVIFGRNCCRWWFCLGKNVVELWLDLGNFYNGILIDHWKFWSIQMHVVHIYWLMCKSDRDWPTITPTQLPSYLLMIKNIWYLFLTKFNFKTNNLTSIYPQKYNSNNHTKILTSHAFSRSSIHSRIKKST